MVTQLALRLETDEWLVSSSSPRLLREPPLHLGWPAQDEARHHEPRQTLRVRRGPGSPKGQALGSFFRRVWRRRAGRNPAYRGAVRVFAFAWGVEPLQSLFTRSLYR